MVFLGSWWMRGMPLVVAMVLAGCQSQPITKKADGAAKQTVAAKGADSGAMTLDVPVAWGGQVRCGSQGCLLAAVEHEAGRVVLHRLEGRSSRFLDAHKVAYHPDSAIWLEDDLIAAAVEVSSSIDIFRVVNQKLIRIQQIEVHFNPRDVVLVKTENGRYTLLATPYSGKDVAWILNWAPNDKQPPSVKHVTWCEAAWHPTRVSKLPGMSGGGVAVACLDDKRVVAVPDSNLLGQPTVLAKFPAISRNAQPSPSGQWLYVSLETGGRNARINMQTGELQWIQSPLTGSVSVAALADDLVVWGESLQLYLQRLGATGVVLETRWHKVSGFATRLQLIDVDGDGERDVIAYNSGGDVIDVVFGPLWDRAKRNP